MEINRKKQSTQRPSLLPADLSRRALNLAILAILYPSFSYANPDGAQIVSGQVSIDTATPGVTTITNSPNAIINWQNFSIAQNEITRFIQQNGQSAVLNRIIGQNPSEILGQLTSNGKVFLINPNGIVFGAGATVDTQGLIASSLNLSDQDFLSGNYHFMAGSSAGNILNEGIIRAGKDGNIILIAPQIQNNGIIKSDGGSITLAAGQELTITNLDDPEIRFQIQAPADSALNLGKLLTEGGAINVFASTIKHSGEINANSVQVDKQGNIQLVAQQDITLTADSKISVNNSQGDAGTVHIDSKTGTTLAQGTIEAQATQTGKGGNIELLGEQVGVLDQAKIDASGENGGGQVLIGGDYQGKNPNVHNANMTYVGKDTMVKADAKRSGDGGKIIAWSNDTTRVHGNISTKGGVNSGNGGFVETSGHNYLDVAGARVDTRAPNGTIGNWLLDPTDITITHGATTAAAFPGNIFVNGGGATSSLTDGDINQALFTSGVVIQTTSANTGALGDITFDSTGGAILVSGTNASPMTLSLNADNNIVFTGANGTTFRAANSAGQLNVQFMVPNGKVITNAGSSVTLDGSSTGPYGLTTAWLSDGRAWDNHGSLNITDNAAVHLGITSSFNNKSGAIANIAGTTGWAFWSNANDDGVINNEGTFSVTKSTAFEAAYNQAASGLLNVKDVNLNLQNAQSISGAINLTPTGATTYATLNVNESHGAPASFTNTTISATGPAGSVLTIGGNVGGTPTANFSGIYAPDVQLNIGGANPGNVSIVGDSLFKTVAYTSGTFALNNALLSINVGDFTLPTVTTHTGNVGYRVRGNLIVDSAFTLPGNLDLVGGWNGSGYAVNPGANANILFGPSGSLSANGDIWMNAGNLISKAMGSSISASNVTLIADKMALEGGTIYGANTVNLLSFKAIDVAATTTGDALSTLELSNAELNTIYSPVLRIGDSFSGAIDIKSVLAPSHISNTLSLTSGGAITQQAGATIAPLPGLALWGASVSLTQANGAGVISGQAASGDFRYRSSNLLTVSTVDGISGISVPVTSNIALESDVGINQQIGANLNGGGLALKTPGWVDLLNAGNNISTVAADLYLGGLGTDGFSFFGGSNLTVGGVLSADGSTWLHGITTNNQYIDVASFALSINQPINAGTGTVDLSADTLTWDATGLASTGRVIGSDIGILPLTPGRPITVGGACVGGTGTCLNINELWKISSPIIGIGFDEQYLGNHVAGDIFIGGITSGGTSITDRNASTTQIGLFSNGGITQGATGINAQNLYIEANGDVMLNAANRITNLAAITLGQNFTFNNAQDININELTCLAARGCGNFSLTASSGNLNIPGQIDVSSGNLYLKATGGSVFGTGTSPDIIAGNVYISAYNNIWGSGGLHIDSPLISQLSATTGFIDVQSFSSGTTLGTVSAYDDIQIMSSSPLTVNGGMTSTIGDIYLSATALNINSLINAGLAEVELEADTLTWDKAGYGQVIGNLVSIQPYTDGLPITVGAACVGGPGTCLSVTELWRVISPTIGIGSDLTGDIFVSGITSGASTFTDRNGATTRIGLISNGGITQSTTGIDVQDLGIEANGEVILNAANKISNLAATIWGSNLTFNNGQGFNIVQMSGGATPSNNYTLEYNIVGIDTCSSYSCGDLNLSSTGSIIGASAPITAGNLAIKSGGDVHLADLALSYGALDISADGNIYSRSVNVAQMNRLNSTNGWIDVQNIGGFMLGSAAITPGTTVANAAGNIMITAMSPLTVNGAIASNGGSVGLTASNGDTLSINAPISAPNGITLTGGTLSGSYAGSYLQYFNNGTTTPAPPTTSGSTSSTTETLNNTVTDSEEQVIAGVLGTAPQPGQLLTDEPDEFNSTGGSTDSASGKGKNSKQCTK